MAQIKTVKTSFGNIDFMFGFRILKSLKQHVGVSDLGKLAEKFEGVTNGDGYDISELMDFVSGLLWVAHENACFFKRESLLIDEKERMYFVVDEIGIDEASKIAFEGFTQMMGSENAKPQKATKKKPPQ